MHTAEHATQQLIELEKKYWQAMQDHDLKTAVSLTDFPCIVAGERGVQAIDQKQFEQMFNSHNEDIVEFDFEDTPEVRMLGPDTAVIAYKIQSVVNKEGQERPMKAIDTSTWIRRGEKWVCAMHTEIMLQ